MRLSVYLAVKGMRARPRQYLLCMFGVFLGVLALTVIMSVSNGFETALVKSILETSGHISVSSSSHLINDWCGLQRTIEGIDGVRTASPCVLGQCMVEYDQAFSGVNLRGVDPRLENSISGMASKMTTGCFEFFSSNEVVLGAALARQLGVGRGRFVRVVCPDGEGYDLRLVGTFETGLIQFDLHTIFVPRRFAQRALGFGGGVSHILVGLDDPLAAGRIAGQISAQTGLDAKSWLDTNKTLLSALSMEKRVMFLVLLLTLVVAGFGIANVLNMTVYEKYRDIGILRAVGAPRRMVMAIFIVQGLIVGVCGALLGVIGGLGTGLFLETYPVSLPGQIYYADKVPVEFHALDFLVVALAACTVAVAAGMFPARRAVFIHPWEAIRYFQ